MNNSAKKSGKEAGQKPSPLPPHRDPALVYTWYQHPNVSIRFLIHDSTEAFKPRNDREVYIVRNSWYPIDVLEATSRLRSHMEPLRRQIYFLSNTPEIHRARIEAGFNSTYVNFACFIDNDTFAPPVSPVPKRFDAVYTGRFNSVNGKEVKRHFLTREIRRLALLDPVFGSNDPVYKQRYTGQPNCVFSNTDRLDPQAVAKIVNQSHCGLILSELEGVCRASSEYLLCGIPVVSSRSQGGRDVWYDSYNSIVVDQPTPASVKRAVAHFIDNPPDAQRIRDDYLRKATVFRERFLTDVLGRIFSDYNVPLQPETVLRAHPIRWWPKVTPLTLARARMMGWLYRILNQRLIIP